MGRLRVRQGRRERNAVSCKYKSRMNMGRLRISEGGGGKEVEREGKKVRGEEMKVEGR